LFFLPWLCTSVSFKILKIFLILYFFQRTRSRTKKGNEEKEFADEKKLLPNPDYFLCFSCHSHRNSRRRATKLRTKPATSLLYQTKNGRLLCGNVGEDSRHESGREGPGMRSTHTTSTRGRKRKLKKRKTMRARV